MRGMLLAMDPPRHNDYRRPMVKRFVPKVMEQLEDRIRAICREIMAAAAEQGDVEFVHDVTSALAVAGDRRAGGPARGGLAIESTTWPR